jgi:hypothetical protein
MFLTSWSRVYLEKLTVAHHVNKYPAFHGNPPIAVGIATGYTLDCRIIGARYPVRILVFFFAAASITAVDRFS